MLNFKMINIALTTKTDVNYDFVTSFWRTKACPGCPCWPPCYVSGVRLPEARQVQAGGDALQGGADPRPREGVWKSRRSVTAITLCNATQERPLILYFPLSMILGINLGWCITRCHEVSPGVTRCHQVSPGVTRCHHVSRCVTSCHQLSPAVMFAGENKPIWMQAEEREENKVRDVHVAKLALPAHTVHT